MDENVLAALALDEAEALAGIEPLHCTLFLYSLLYSFLSAGLRLSTTLSYLMPQVPSPSTEPRPSSSFVREDRKAVRRTKKMAASVTLRPLYYPRRYKSKQTQRQSTTILGDHARGFLGRGCGVQAGRDGG